MPPDTIPETTTTTTIPATTTTLLDAAADQVVRTTSTAIDTAMNSPQLAMVVGVVVLALFLTFWVVVLAR